MCCDMLKIQDGIIAIVGKLNYNTKYMLVPFLIFSLEVLDNFVGGGVHPQLYAFMEQPN